RSSWEQKTNLTGGIVQLTTLEVAAHAHLHMPRQSRREPALDRRARYRRIFGEGPEGEDASVEQVPYRAAQLEIAPRQRDRQVGDDVVGQLARDVLLVAAQPLPPYVAGVQPNHECHTRLGRLRTKDRDREPGVHAVARHQRELVARRHRFAGRVARGREGRGRFEGGPGVAVVGVRPDTRGAAPLERELQTAATRGADVLEVAAGDGRGNEEDVVTHVGAVHVGA